MLQSVNQTLAWSLTATVFAFDTQWTRGGNIPRTELKVKSDWLRFSHFATSLKGAAQRHFIGIFQITPNRQAMRQTGHFHPQWRE